MRKSDILAFVYIMMFAHICLCCAYDCTSSDCNLGVTTLVLLSVELSVNCLLECDVDSNVAVAGAVLHAIQVMSLMLT